MSFCLWNIEIKEDLNTPIKKGPLGLYKELDERYYQNKLKNEFLDHNNIGTDTWIELLGAIVQVLCHFSSEILKLEKI